MAKVEFVGDKSLFKKKNKINQGDIIYCEGLKGALSFWAIYNSLSGTVTDLNGAGDKYISGRELYLNEIYGYWKIIKRIPCERVKITIEEIE